MWFRQVGGFAPGECDLGGNTPGPRVWLVEVEVEVGTGSLRKVYGPVRKVDTDNVTAGPRRIKFSLQTSNNYEMVNTRVDSAEFFPLTMT